MPSNDFWGGLLQGLGGSVSQGLLTRTRQNQARLEQELDDLNRRLQEQTKPEYRDAYAAAIYKLGQSGKPGTGYKELAKRIGAMGDQAGAAEATRRASPLIFNQSAMERATAPAFSLGPPEEPTVGATPFPRAQAAALAASPTAPVTAVLPPSPAPPTGQPAALPATSPIAATGASAGIQEEGPPSEEEMLAYGRNIGMKPPERLPQPERPPGFQTRAMREQFKIESTNWRNAEDTYTSHMNRLAIEIAAERRRVATEKAAQREKEAGREFRRGERESGQAFRAEESQLQRETTLEAARIRKEPTVGGEEREEQKEERKRKADAEKAFYAEMRSINRRLNDPDRRRALDVDRAENLREAAKREYETRTGKPAPAYEGAEAPKPRAKAVKAGAPPEEPAARATVPPAARSKVQELIRTQGRAGACKAIADSPSIPQPVKDAMRIEFRCP